jgi:hypothetical protein
MNRISIFHYNVRNLGFLANVITASLVNRIILRALRKTGPARWVLLRVVREHDN